jgi:hypothetical protein
LAYKQAAGRSGPFLFGVSERLLYLVPSSTLFKPMAKFLPLHLAPLVRRWMVDIFLSKLRLRIQKELCFDRILIRKEDIRRTNGARRNGMNSVIGLKRVLDGKRWREGWVGEFLR